MATEIYISPDGTGDGTKTSPTNMYKCNKRIQEWVNILADKYPTSIRFDINVHCLQGQYTLLPASGVTRPTGINVIGWPKILKLITCRFIGGYQNFDEEPSSRSSIKVKSTSDVHIWDGSPVAPIPPTNEIINTLRLINFDIEYEQTFNEPTVCNYSLYNCTVKQNDNINQPYTQLFSECENCSLTGITTILSSVNSVYYESAGWIKNIPTPLFENIGNSYINQNIPLTLYSEISCKRLESPKGLILYGNQNPIIFKNNNGIYNYNSLSCVIEDSNLESYITNNEINVKYIKVDNQSNSNLYLSGNIFPVIDVKSYTLPFALDYSSSVISSITLNGNMEGLNIYNTIILNNCNCEDQNISLNLLSANYTIADSEVNKLTTQTITSFSIGPAGGYIKFKPKKFTKIVYTY